MLDLYFKIYLRTEFDLVEEHIRMVLDELNSSFSTYELQPGIHTFEDISEDVLFNILQPENPGVSDVFDIEFDDIPMKKNLL